MVRVFCLRHNESFALWVTIKNTAYCCTWYLVQPSVVGGYLGCSATNDRSQLYYLFLSLSLPFYLNSTHNTKKDYIYLLSFVCPLSLYYYNPSTPSKRTVSYRRLPVATPSRVLRVSRETLSDLRSIAQRHVVGKRDSYWTKTQKSSFSKDRHAQGQVHTR
jgi:hypothetical protein